MQPAYEASRLHLFLYFYADYRGKKGVTLFSMRGLHSEESTRITSDTLIRGLWASGAYLDACCALCAHDHTNGGLPPVWVHKPRLSSLSLCRKHSHKLPIL